VFRHGGQGNQPGRQGEARRFVGSWRQEALRVFSCRANPSPAAVLARVLYNVAENMAQIVGTNETVTVPAGTFTGCVKTKEWSMLEAVRN